MSCVIRLKQTEQPVFQYARGLVCACFAMLCVSVSSFLYVLFACLYAIGLCIGICVMYAFLWIVRRFESPKALYMFPVVVVIDIIIIHTTA